jgi:hypothetical protein
MAMYYFHTRRGDTVYHDPEGSDLPDINTAKEEALASARELLAEAIKTAQDDVPDCFILADENDQELATIPLRDVVPKKLLGK